MSPFDVNSCREQFPILRREVDGRLAVFLDGPAGSQVPHRVIDAMNRYLGRSNANLGGAFATTHETGELLQEARAAAADLVGASEPGLTAFGANMTTLTQAVARALARTWEEGDEIVVTRLDHDANVTPWVQAADDSGAEVRHVSFREEDTTLDLEDLRAKLNENTRLVAVGAASNATGTINPIREIVDLAGSVGALVFVDAVHYAPHALMDVDDWGCDFLVCSAYKFFGPHGVGILWGRREPMEQLPVYKLRPCSNEMPWRWESGTQNHEGIAGTLEAIRYLADLGRRSDPGAADRRAALEAAFRAIEGHERTLAARLLHGLSTLPGVRIWGITDPRRLAERVPTVSFTHESHSPREIARYLGERGIFVWDGNYYALAVTESLGLEPEGMVRVGLLHYNTAGEVDRLIEALHELLGRG